MRSRVPRILSAFFLLAAFLNLACNPVTNNEVGSPLDTQIPSLTFTVDSTFTAYGQLVARGTVKNGGNSQVTTPWYVECVFYTDSTQSMTLGGNNVQMTTPLNPGQGTFWSISFSSSVVEVRNYPNFRIGNLRAVYKK